jgi:hypothetical protein
MHDLPKRAVVYASTQRRGEVTFDSWGKHDDITVYNAVRCSMSIPHFFQPQWMDNRRVYDGRGPGNSPSGSSQALQLPAEVLMDGGYKALLDALESLAHDVRGISLKRGDAHEPSIEGSIRSIGLVGEVYSP